MAECCPHPALEPLPLFEGECVRLGDDGNHVDLVVDGLHELNIQGLQAGCTGDRGASSQRHTSDFSISGTRALDKERWDREKGSVWWDSPVAERGDEVEAAVNSVVNDVSAIEAALVVEVALKLVVDVADDGVETGRGKFISVQTFTTCRSKRTARRQIKSQRSHELLSVCVLRNSSLLTSLGCWWRLRSRACRPPWDGASPPALQSPPSTPRSEPSFLFFLRQETENSIKWCSVTTQYT